MYNLININQQDKKIIDGLKISYDSLNEDNNQIKQVNENYEKQLNELKQDKATKDIVTGKQIGRASCRERVLRLV